MWKWLVENFHGLWNEKWLKFIVVGLECIFNGWRS